MSQIHNYRTGINNVGSYQVSGRPFLTGSNITGSGTNNGEVKISFPSITKSFTVINRGATSLIIHFDTRANTDVITNHHYLTLSGTDDSFGFDVKCKEVYLSSYLPSGIGSFELHGELTGIDQSEMHAMSGSGINT